MWIGAEELTPEELPFLRFAAEAQERLADLEQKLRAEEDHPVLLSHVPSLALIVHLIDCVDGEARGPVSRAATGGAPGRPRGGPTPHSVSPSV